jgi:hypothetical protein
MEDGGVSCEELEGDVMNETSLRKHVLYLLKEDGAHVSLERAIKGVPVDLRGKRPKGAEHSLWELVEHIRLAQRDILEFTRNPKYQSAPFPEGYWPATKAPPNEKAWSKSIRDIRTDLEGMCNLVADESQDLFKPLAHGTGQTLLREALLLADHNAYHLGQIVVVRRLLGDWK